jgi:hypothetical protein
MQAPTRLYSAAYANRMDRDRRCGNAIAGHVLRVMTSIFSCSEALVTTADEPGSKQPPADEAVGRPNSSSSRQQTHRGQRTQTGSPQFDRASAVDSTEGKAPARNSPARKK